MKVLTVIGARPQFVKASTVSRALRDVAGVTEVMVHTGQHHDDSMSKVFFDELEIPEPDANLGIAGGLHGAMTGRMLEALETVMVETAPDWVIVYGDTNSTLAAALAAVKLHLPIAHVEAGLRSWNRRMPEEINRVLTDHVSTMLFAPHRGGGGEPRTRGDRGRSRPPRGRRHVRRRAVLRRTLRAREQDP
jgi:UDP-GlcNAc3NAcA epimerase